MSSITIKVGGMGGDSAYYGSGDLNAYNVNDSDSSLPTGTSWTFDGSLVLDKAMEVEGVLTVE